MSSAARYIPRSPRYVFRPQDQKLMRFAEMETKGVTSKASVRDLSTTGISFVTSPEQPLQVGEMLKLEFNLPGGSPRILSDGPLRNSQVAWFANVVRIEKKAEWDPRLGELPYVLVGLSFHKIPTALVTAIAKSLLPHLHESERDTFDINALDRSQVIFFLGLSGTLALCLTAMALPIHIWQFAFRQLF